MAEVFPLRPPSSPLTLQRDDLIGSDVFAGPSSLAATREPLPAFVFPMQSPRHVAEDSASTVTSASNGEAGNGRRRASRSKPEHISINAFPPFEFHPSTEEATPTTSASSTNSPTRSLPIPSRVGHRRGGSEFIGGDGTTAGRGLMSSSPTKAEGGLPSPSGARRGPPGSRRGHAHRRSGAISSNDVSNIIRPPIDIGESMSESVPNTPSDPNMIRQSHAVLDRSTSQPVITTADTNSSRLSIRRDSAPSIGQNRPRVGFSDTVEFIPRPLSTISSETSSSMSTVRASHSVTGSITSIVSGDISSPLPVRKAQAIPECPREIEYNDARPRSAGAMLDNYPPMDVQAGMPMIMERASSANTCPGPDLYEGIASRIPRQRNLLSSQAAVDDIAAQFSKSLSHDRREGVLPPPDLNDVRRRHGEQVMLNSLPVGRPRSSPELKDAKRQRNVRSWAGSILSRKGKSRNTSGQDDTQDLSLSSPGDFALSDDFSLADMNFDEDTTYVIHNPQYAVPRRTNADFSGFSAREPSAFRSSDSHSPVLDLDAALYPLEAPGDIEEGAGSRYPSTKRRMHSGGATGGFTGPGMHYHRRAESAPEMAPVDYHTFGLNRLGSNSAMADVFEEDEEEDVTARSEKGQSCVQEKPAVDDLSGLGVQIVDVNAGDEAIHPNSLRENISRSDSCCGQPLHGASNTKREPKTSTVGVLPDDLVPIEIVDAAEEPRYSIVTKSSDESTITSVIPLDTSNCGQPETPTDYTFTRPLHYLDATEAHSSVSSPDFASTSFDVPRLHTATSSITDRTTISSRRAGGVGQGSTYSTEDVPSLTSSASTMISSHPPRTSTCAETRSCGERSMSFSATVPRRARPVSAGKRSSLASLSRLVGGSYGEKSKLSIESRAQSEDAEKPEKKSKNRISRLMRFWKSKESLK
ncbi:hypothetical protein MMC26_006203 [Xylographa opegraphella]|nr:hypothetical protein [Xylographa opegraphella]